MPRHPYAGLSRRERQIMDVLYRRGMATANEVIAELPDERHSSTVRTQLRLLEEKGEVRRERDGHRYVYKPVISRAAARKSALRHVVDTFFDGSAAQVMSTLLSNADHDLSPEDRKRLVDLVEKAEQDARNEKDEKDGPP